MTTKPLVALPQAATDRAEHLATLCEVLTLVRRGEATTRSELVLRSGLSRSVVTQRVGQLVDLGLVRQGSLAPSTGGRSPRRLGFRAERGCILAVAMGATGATIGLTDLAGQPIETVDAPIAVGDGPDHVLTQVVRLADELIDRPPTDRSLTGGSGDRVVWAVGVGIPGPVEFASGRPVSPPIMPGWDGYDIRGHLGARFGVPVWVDNDVNVMALGELRAGVGRGVDNLLFVKIGTGIGAGLVSRGLIHRGSQGAAGDIGHVAVDESSPVVCRCGNTGCLESLAGGAAIARDAARAVREGRSPVLAGLRPHGAITARDVARAAHAGDAVAAELLARSGRWVGETLATLVNFFNPSLVVLGGRVADSGPAYLSTVRAAIYRRSLPLATRDLRLEVSALGSAGGLLGTAQMVLDELFTPRRLGEWITGGLPGQAGTAPDEAEPQKVRRSAEDPGRRPA